MLDDCDKSSGEAAPNLSNIGSVLVLEDDGLLAILLEDQLQMLGVDRVVICHDLATATEAAGTTDIDVAILDVHVHGQTTYAVADILAARGIPVLFCSGLASEDLDARYRDWPHLIKPYGENELRATLVTLTQAK